MTNPRPRLSPGPGASDEMRDSGRDAPGPEGARAFGFAADKPAVTREEC